MIHNFETKLASNLTLAISLTDAEKFHRDHEDIKPFVDVRRRKISIENSKFSEIVFSEFANESIIYNEKSKNRRISFRQVKCPMVQQI